MFAVCKVLYFILSDDLEMKFTVSKSRLVVIEILNFKMILFFGIFIFLYFLKLSAGSSFQYQ